MALYTENEKLEELDYFQKLVHSGLNLELNVVVFTPEDVHPTKRLINALHYDIESKEWYRKWIPFPVLIYDRCRFQRTYRFPLVRKFRSTYPELTYLNRPMSHKWGIHQILSQNRNIRPYLPATVQYRNASDLTKFLQNHKLVYLKPIDGTGGRGIIRIQKLVDGMCLIEGRDRDRRIIAPQRIKPDRIASRLSSWELKDRYLIQQGISLVLKDGRVHDYRLLIQKNGNGDWEVTGCAGRIGAQKSITSNLHGGGAAIPMMKLLQSRFKSIIKITAIQKSMEKLSHDVVIHLEKNFGRLCEMALDIAVDPNGHVWLLEVNPKPAREVFYRIKETHAYENAIRRPLEYATWLSRQDQQEES